MSTRSRAQLFAGSCALSYSHHCIMARQDTEGWLCRVHWLPSQPRGVIHCPLLVRTLHIHCTFKLVSQSVSRSHFWLSQQQIIQRMGRVHASENITKGLLIAPSGRSNTYQIARACNAISLHKKIFLNLSREGGHGIALKQYTSFRASCKIQREPQTVKCILEVTGLCTVFGSRSTVWILQEARNLL